MNEKKKTLTVEDLAEVTGGLARIAVADTDEESPTLGKSTETKYTQREGRSPVVGIVGVIAIR